MDPVFDPDTALMLKGIRIQEAKLYRSGFGMMNLERESKPLRFNLNEGRHLDPTLRLIGIRIRILGLMVIS